MRGEDCGLQSQPVNGLLFPEMWVPLLPFLTVAHEPTRAPYIDLAARFTLADKHLFFTLELLVLAPT